MSVVEATAPVRIDLGGGPLDLWPLYLFHPGAIAVSVAIDRRAHCRVETAEGVRIESKDSLLRAEGKDVEEVLATGRLALAAHVLRALGIETGVRVTTQSKVPAGAGLGAESALAVAIAGAATQATGRTLDAQALCAAARDAEAQASRRPVAIRGHHAALRGGVVGLALEPGRVRTEPVATDPGRVEESLMLVDSGEPAAPGIDWEAFKADVDGEPRGREALDVIGSVARRVAEALVAHRYAAIGNLMAEEWEARKRVTPAATTPIIDRIVEAARAAGGAGWACGSGGGGMVAVWATPGERGSGTRERVEESLRAEGFRPLKFRVDLRGLEVE